jgi:hypothetical protein
MHIYKICHPKIIKSDNLRTLKFILMKGYRIIPESRLFNTFSCSIDDFIAIGYSERTSQYALTFFSKGYTVGSIVAHFLYTHRSLFQIF